MPASSDVVVKEVPCEEGNHLSFTFPYLCGVVNPHVEYFYRGEADCARMFGVKPGQRVRDTTNFRCATAIGMRPKPDGQLAMWYHVDGSDGAGVYNVGVTLISLSEQRELAPAATDPSVVRISTTKKVPLPAEKLKLTFRYPAGVGSTHERLFDVRQELCLQLFGVEPGRRVRVGGDLATAIGMREDEHKLTMWFHDDDNSGAGLYPLGMTIEVLSGIVPLDRLTVLPEVPPEQLKLTLSEEVPTADGTKSLFDTRSDACATTFQLRPGQSVRVLKKDQVATVVGMRPAVGDGGSVRLWLKDASGKAVSHTNNTAIEIIGDSACSLERCLEKAVPITVVEVSDFPINKLQPTFSYKTLSSAAMTFDVRPEACLEHFQLVPGQRVVCDGGMATAIGMHEKPVGAALAMWFHMDGAPGAGVFTPGTRLVPTKTVISPQPIVVLASVGQVKNVHKPIPSEPLQLNFTYKVGGAPAQLIRHVFHGKEQLAMEKQFDVRPEICKELFGVRSGQRVRVDGHDATAIGAAPDDGVLKMWYHQDDRYGAGLYAVGSDVTLTDEHVKLGASKDAPSKDAPSKDAMPASDNASLNQVKLVVKYLDTPPEPLVPSESHLRGTRRAETLFDVRKEKCLEWFGAAPGQHFIRDVNTTKKVTRVVGMAADNAGSGPVKLFFMERGSDIAGAYVPGTVLTKFDDRVDLDDLLD